MHLSHTADPVLVIIIPHCVSYIWRGAVYMGATCPQWTGGPCLNLANPTRERLVGSLHGACPQAHLAPGQEKRGIRRIGTFREYCFAAVEFVLYWGYDFGHICCRLSAFWLGKSPGTFKQLYTVAAFILFALRLFIYRSKGCAFLLQGPAHPFVGIFSHSSNYVDWRLSCNAYELKC